MHLVELLKLRNLDISKRIKIVRHKDKRYDLERLMVIGHMDTYQSIQGKAVFHDCDFVVSCIGLDRKRARFLGVYQVSGHSTVGQVGLPPGYPYSSSPSNHYYHMSKLPGFEDLEERVVIEWGLSTQGWHQWLSDRRPKQVSEILPKGYFKPFPGFLDFTLSHAELCRIVKHPDANRDWSIALSSVAGVYLILDTRSGKQYVGSAYGDCGIFGRWENYVSNGHGGNKLLVDLLKSAPGAFADFQFSVLETLSTSLTAREVISREALHKQKLGSAAFGLNAN